MIERFAECGCDPSYEDEYCNFPKAIALLRRLLTDEDVSDIAIDADAFLAGLEEE